MKRLHIIRIHKGKYIPASSLGVPYTAMKENGYWIGSAREPDRRYDFWKPGLYYAEVTIPANLQLWEEIHVGVRNPESRIRWIVEDLDEEYLVLMKKETYESERTSERARESARESAIRDAERAEGC